MFVRALGYELRRSAVPFAALSLLTMGLVLLMRMQVFPSMDILLFYLIFFGAAGVSIYRFYHTMFGREAIFMHSLPLSASSQIVMRGCAMLVQSAFAVLLSALALILQGGTLGEMMTSRSFGGGAALFGVMTLSLWQFMLPICVILTLAHLPLCRGRRGVWMIVWAVIVFAVIGGLSDLTAGMIGGHIIIRREGGVMIAAFPTEAWSIGISLNGLLWNVLIPAPLIALMCALTRRYQLL